MAKYVIDINSFIFFLNKRFIEVRAEVDPEHTMGGTPVYHRASYHNVP